MSDKTAEKSASLGTERRSLRLAAVVVFTLFAVWTLLPAVTSVHLEAFSAQVQSIAILLNSHGRHGLLLADQSYPITTEFLYMSRSGLVDALQAMMRISGSTGDGVFQTLMIFSMAAFAWSSVSVAQRWSGESRLLLFTVLLITPGLVDIGFFFSDNLPSAALAMLSLACVPREGAHDAKWLGVGVLWASAMLCRFDAVLIAPFLGLCLLLGKPKIPVVAMRAAGLILGFVLVESLAQTLTPFRQGEAIQITRLFGTLHDWIQGDSRMQEVALGFFGILTPILVAAGVARNIKKRDWRWIAAFVVMPAVFYLAVIPKAIEIRMFLLLGTPALLMHGSAGLRIVWEQWQSKEKSLFPMLVRPVSLSLTLFVLFGPVNIVIRDGPRSAVGRFWNTIVWREWQESVTDGMGRLYAVVASVQPRQTLLAISSQYNADDFFRLRMLEAGYDVLEPEMAAKLYPGASEVFQKGDRTVAHLLCPDPYLMLGQWYKQPYFYTQALQIMWGLDALKSIRFDRAVTLNWQVVPGFFLAAVPQPDTPTKLWQTNFPQNPIVPRKGTTPDGAINVTSISSEKVEALRQSAHREVEAAQQRAKAWVPIRSKAEFHAKFNWRFGDAP